MLPICIHAIDTVYTVHLPISVSFITVRGCSIASIRSERFWCCNTEIHVHLQIAIGLRFEIAVIKVVHPYKTVFSAGCIALPWWVNCNSIYRISLGIFFVKNGAAGGWVYPSDLRVYGTEMTFDPANFFFEDKMPKASFEFALASRSGGDGHGFLTTAQKNLTPILSV